MGAVLKVEHERRLSWPWKGRRRHSSSPRKTKHGFSQLDLAFVKVRAADSGAAKG